MASVVRKRNPEKSKQAILEAAENIFVKKGFAGTNMSEIAKLSGMSQGLIHHYFGSKKNLLDEVRNRYGYLFGEILIPLLEKRYFDKDFISLWVRRYLKFWKDNPNLVRILLWRHLEGETEPWEGTNDFYQFSIKKIQEAQEKGILRNDIDPGHFIYIMTGSIINWITSKKIYCARSSIDLDDVEVDEEYLRDLIGILTRGMIST
jgi:TetR/AcrR family transcriptional regulator